MGGQLEIIGGVFEFALVAIGQRQLKMRRREIVLKLQRAQQAALGGGVLRAFAQLRALPVQFDSGVCGGVTHRRVLS